MLRWLGWLAELMQRRGQTEFAFEDLNVTWIPSEREYGFGLVFPLAGGLLSGLVGWRAFGFVGGLLGGLLFVGLAVPILRWEQMQRRTQFSFQDLNAWIESKRESGVVRWFSVVFASMACGLVFGLIGGLLFGLLFGLRGGLVFGLFGVLLGGVLFARGAGFGGGLHPEELEELHFAWQDFRKDLVFNLFLGFLGLVLGLVAGLFFGGQSGWLQYGLVLGLVAGLVAGLVGGLSSGLRPQSVSQHSAPNRGTIRSLRYALKFLLASMILILIFLFLVRHLWPYSLRYAVAINFFFAGFGLAFIRGGGFALRHYIIRVCLWLLRRAPLRYVRFLNEATERLFLIRHGGGYEFLHRTFRDYMAATHGPDANIHTTCELKSGIVTAS